MTIDAVIRTLDPAAANPTPSDRVHPGGDGRKDRPSRAKPSRAGPDRTGPDRSARGGDRPVRRDHRRPTRGSSEPKADRSRLPGRISARLPNVPEPSRAEPSRADQTGAQLRQKGSHSPEDAAGWYDVRRGWALQPGLCHRLSGHTSAWICPGMSPKRWRGSDTNGRNTSAFIPGRRTAPRLRWWPSGPLTWGAASTRITTAPRVRPRSDPTPLGAIPVTRSSNRSPPRSARRSGVGVRGRNSKEIIPGMSGDGLTDSSTKPVSSIAPRGGTRPGRSRRRNGLVTMIDGSIGRNE